MQTDTIAALHVQVAALERGSRADPEPSRLPFGLPELDAHLPGGGLALGAVHELFAGGPAVEHGAAPALFAAGVLARRPGPVLWIAVRSDLYPPALARVGFDPARLVLVRTRHGALRATEEGLRHPGLAGVVCEHEGRLGLVASRRLQLAAEATDVLGFVLRRPPGPQLDLSRVAHAELRQEQWHHWAEHGEAHVHAELDVLFQRICCFLFMRLATSSLTALSTNAVEVGSPRRRWAA